MKEGGRVPDRGGRAAQQNGVVRNGGIDLRRGRPASGFLRLSATAEEIMLADDCSVSYEQLVAIRAAADRALRDGGALGIFPTPVDDKIGRASCRERVGQYV